LESSAEKHSALPEPGELLFKAKSDISLAVASNSPSVSIRLANEGGDQESIGRGGNGEEASSAQPTSSPLPATSAVLALTAQTVASAPIPRRTSISSMRQAKSLETLTVGAMWSSFVEEIILEKGPVGLGFSILDYQDPQSPTETVIVVRSLIRGGPAATSGAVLPGDRLVYVNDCRLDNASLDKAVQALKGSPYGPVRLGIAKPLEEVVPRRQQQQLVRSRQTEEQPQQEKQRQQHRQRQTQQQPSAGALPIQSRAGEGLPRFSGTPSTSATNDAEGSLPAGEDDVNL